MWWMRVNEGEWDGGWRNIKNVIICIKLPSLISFQTYYCILLGLFTACDNSNQFRNIVHSLEHKMYYYYYCSAELLLKFT